MISGTEYQKLLLHDVGQAYILKSSSICLVVKLSLYHRWRVDGRIELPFIRSDVSGDYLFVYDGRTDGRTFTCFFLYFVQCICICIGQIIINVWDLQTDSSFKKYFFPLFKGFCVQMRPDTQWRPRKNILYTTLPHHIVFVERTTWRQNWLWNET